ERRVLRTRSRLARDGSPHSVQPLHQLLDRGGAGAPRPCFRPRGYPDEGRVPADEAEVPPGLYLGAGTRRLSARDLPVFRKDRNREGPDPENVRLASPRYDLQYEDGRGV